MRYRVVGSSLIVCGLMCHGSQPTIESGGGDVAAALLP